MATNPQQMQAQADMARMQQGAAQPYMPSPTSSGGGAGRGFSNMAMKKGGKVKKMAMGGMTFDDDREPGSSGGGKGTQVGAPGLPGYDNSSGAGGDKKGGIIKAKKMAKGGSASSRADGIATKGKTRGKMC